ncbi:TRAP transporter small permease subunit [Alcaligenes faecalis]|uniref:TRAP transporter small permease subunit n=1 Tax=Alcaligenes faecalis TaxID=511 RepID=UPI0029336E58|nr:TRAP transporter small permease subunit [Alcaligenes faecalis]MDV2117595.1 TRAP transporter small permease subunit [Alcaligenes faecalis]
MQKILVFIDRFNTWIGQLFGWLVLALTLFVSFEVFSRYVLSNPHAWAFDMMNMLYGGLFMMAGAYTLSKNGHVRGDVLYGFFPPRLQAALDLILYILFFIPGVVAMFWAGYYFAAESWAIMEHSNITANGPPIYPFKAIIPLAGFCLLLQSFVEMVYCVRCLRDGTWPSRDKDVEEVDVDKLRNMVDVKSDDLKKLDAFVTSNGKKGSPT